MRTYVFIFAIVSAQAAQAQCGNYDKISKNLKKHHAEAMVFHGFSKSNIVETWANGATGTWTVVQQSLVIVQRKGGSIAMSCAKVVASGKGWFGEASVSFGLPGSI